jgi:hypothetical protein
MKKNNNAPKQNLTIYFIKQKEELLVMFILQSHTDCSHKMAGESF